MKKATLLILSALFVHAAAAQQPSETPKPGPEYLKMLGWCGEYTINGKTYATPLGPGAKIQGRLIGRPILDGFAIEGIYLYEGQGPCGETQGRETISYDPTTQKYYYVYHSNNGYSEQAPFIVEGDVSSWESTRAQGGKQFKLRGTDTDLPDGTGFVRKEEITVDGTTWLPAQEATFVKVKAVEGAGDEQELIGLEQEWCRAEVKRDGAALNRLLADGYTCGTEEGTFMTKDRLIRHIQSDNFLATSVTAENLKVQVYGGMAVVTGLIRLSEGSNKSDRIIITDTWLKRDDLWQCVASHESKPADDTAKILELTPEMKKLEFHVGDWAYEGQQVDPLVAGLPYGPAGKFSGTITTRFVLGGHFVEERFDEQNPSGRTTGLSITGYNAKANNYVQTTYLNDGSTESSTGTVSPDGRTWTIQSTITTSQGDKVPSRGVIEFSPDGTRFTVTMEVSPDNGKTWKYWGKEEGRKTKR